MEKNNENKKDVNVTKKSFEAMKDFAIKKAIPTIKNTAENTKNAVTSV